MLPAPNRLPALLALLGLVMGPATDAQILNTGIGLPLTRNYVLEEIGGASRSVQLAFDPIGRLAVVSGDGYHVLNDSTWIGMADDDLPGTLSRVVTDDDGRMYFGALADWGVAEIGPEGRIHTHSLRPTSCPDWVASNRFTQILSVPDGVCFAGLNGLVWWDRATNDHFFHATAGLTGVFAVGPDVFVSSHLAGLQRINTREQRVETSPDPAVRATVADATAALGPRQVLLSTAGRSLLVFDGTSVSRWHGAFDSRLPARTPIMRPLPDGGIVLAIDGRGLFFLNSDGELAMSLTSAEYHRIQDMVTGEPGVLWVATEQTVQQLLYGDPVTVIDQRLGIPVRWPQVIAWEGRTLVATSGDLYDVARSADGAGHRFEPIAWRPQFGTWAVASAGQQLLYGNPSGVHLRQGTHHEQILSGLSVHQLVMVGTDFCYAIGEATIAAIRRVDGRWIEAAPRVAGVGFPALVHRAGASAWIEIGVNRVARVSFADGVLRTRVFDQFPWSDKSWTNVGSVGDIVMIGNGKSAVFFDETSGEFCESPELHRLIAASPYPVVRLASEQQGPIWVTHAKGVFLAIPDPTEACGFRFDTSLTSNLRDFQPRVQFLNSTTTAVSTGWTVYLVARDLQPTPARPRQAALVSITDRRSGRELHAATRALEPVSAFSYAQNSLLFRFFSGTYRSLRPPEYKFTVAGPGSDWSVRGTDSHLDLRDLREGHYRLAVQLFDGAVATGSPLRFEFVIAPPWYRSTSAYLGYAAAALLAAWLLMRWTGGRARRRNVLLEALVSRRTEELRTTMSRLNDETRNAAVLAERGRIAGEIHDSVQQGLSGVMLQLGATLRLPGLRPEVASRLEVARSMVSFTRHEVQQAVWNLESPLLESAGLGEALQRLANLINSGTTSLHVEVIGGDELVPLPTRHQLLRIAQEAVTNSVRHGNARIIDVRLEASTEGVSLEIRDDGLGFSPEEVLANQPGHFGLRGMRARASRIGAEIQITSAPGRGTTIRVSIGVTAHPNVSHANHS